MKGNGRMRAAATAAIVWLLPALAVAAALAGCASGAVRVEKVKTENQLAEERRQLAVGELSAFAFSPDGQTLAFTRHYEGRSVVGFMEVAGGRFFQLEADGAHLAAPSFSPDGATLAFEHSVGGDPATHRLALLNLKTMRYQFLTRAEGTLQFRLRDPERPDGGKRARNTSRYCPVFSPDGARLLYQRPVFWTKGAGRGLEFLGLDPFDWAWGATMLPIVLPFAAAGFALRAADVASGAATVVYETDDDATAKSKNIFQSYRNYWEIWELELRSGKERRIGDYEDHFSGCPQYYGDNKILFSHFVHDAPKAGDSHEHWDYVVYMADINHPVPSADLAPAVTRADFPPDMEVRDAAWPSPARDGSVLLAIDDREYGEGIALWDGEAARILKIWRTNGLYDSLALSPDAGLAAYRHRSRRGKEYWLMEVAGRKRWNFDIPPREEWSVIHIAEE